MVYEGEAMERAASRRDQLGPARGVTFGAVLGALLWGLVIGGVLAIFTGCASAPAQPHSLAGRLALEAALAERVAQ